MRSVKVLFYKCVSSLKGVTETNHTNIYHRRSPPLMEICAKPVN